MNESMFKPGEIWLVIPPRARLAEDRENSWMFMVLKAMPGLKYSRMYIKSWSFETCRVCNFDEWDLRKNDLKRVHTLDDAC